MTRTQVARWALALAFYGLLLQVGGSLYEHLVVDTAWPTRPELIQPGRGGLDRKLFWIPTHGLVTLALPVALWACWRARPVRTWVLVSLSLYLVIRFWTFAYFIPVALRFEVDAQVSEAEARAWVWWSVARAPLLLGSTWALARARSLG